MITYAELYERLPGVEANGSADHIPFTCLLCGHAGAYVRIDRRRRVFCNCPKCFKTAELAEALALAGETIGEEAPEPEPEPEPHERDPDVEERERVARGNAHSSQPHDNLLTRVPPSNLEAEQSVLGAIFLDPDAITPLMESLRVNAFYDERHRLIYRAMLTLKRREEPIDVVTLRPVLEAWQAYEKVGGGGYLAQLAIGVPTAQHILHYAKIVQAKAVQREMAWRAREVAMRAYNENPDNIEAWMDDCLTHLSAVVPTNGNTTPQGPRQLPAPQTASQWFNDEETRFANTTFIWDGILEAGGLSIITGKKGNGKSTFARTLSLVLTRGVQLLDRNTEPSRVWYIDLEPGGRGRIKTWRELGWTDNDALDLNTIPPVADNPKKFEWLRENIIAHHYNVVVLDTLFKFLKIEGANDYEKGVYAQVPLEEIARDTGCHFICLHHARKNSMAEGMSVAEVILGATSLAGAACACMLINRRGGTYTFRMDPPRYGEQIEGEVVLEQGNGGWVFGSGQYKGRWIKNAKVWTLDAIRKQMPPTFLAKDLTVEDPMTEQKLQAKTVRFLLKSLVDAGELTTTGEGVKGDPYVYRLKT